MKPDLPIDTQILWLAAELVERGHCKGALARRADGTQAEPIADDAVSWCMIGATIKASRLLTGEGVPDSIVSRLWIKTGIGESVPSWNDHHSRTAAEVALALRTA